MDLYIYSENTFNKISNDEEISIEIDQSSLKLQKDTHLILLENICQSIGLEFHLRKGKIILRNFVLFCFPRGIPNFISKSEILKIPFKNLIPKIIEIHKNHSDLFNSNNFEKFILSTNLSF
jgi:hypothetical protein